MAHLCTRARISQCVERDYLWSKQCGGGREGSLYREHSNYSAREKLEFLISRRLIQSATRLLREFDRFRASSQKESKLTASGESHHTLPSLELSRNYFGSLSSARYVRNCGRIREHPPWDFHYQRQRGRGPPCSGFKV